MSAAPASTRRFLLMVWAAHLGASVRPVGVLAVAGGDQARHAVVWLPRVWEAADGWQQRLAGARADDVAAALPSWLEEDGGLRLVEIDAGPGDVDARTAAEIALDEVLAVIVPVLDHEG